jgi:glucose/arabinose dehydrogenase
MRLQTIQSATRDLRLAAYGIDDGRIRVIENGILSAENIFDISDKVSGASEQGLLGLAFHPTKFGRLYVNYTDRDGDTRVVEYRMGKDRVDPASARELVKVAQPYSNHNGGGIAFGPDSNLWIGMGDGGSAGDPEGRAQNPRELLGKLLRIRVGPTGTYTIPSDNPANAAGADSELRPEIWSVGMRNPWRFTFDRDTNELWIGDVGQNAIEEIDFVARPLRARAEPLNFGWDLYEGTHPYPPGSNAAPKRGLTFPIVEYSHDLGTSVTGGYVYRGGASPALLGTYLYADYGSGRIWGLRRTDSDGTPLAKPENRQLRDTKYSIASFGEGAEGELYVVDLDGGVYRLSAR